MTEEFTLPDPLTDIWVTAEGNYDAPGALDVSWSASGADDHVRTVIPINHHAGAPTFTSCVASRDEEHFVVPAEMVDPLSVITGLEFQGLHYGQYAAINTDVGCVQATVFFHEFVDVQYTN